MQKGDCLGPYTIVAPLGAGGMGEVYKARDTRLDRTVAIKILPTRVSSDPDSRSRFAREARAISALNHRHICMVHDIGQEDGVDFLVMEYLEGETLAARLTKGALPLEEALTIGIAIAEALDTAHNQGIVHRDLKPGNVMLTKAGAKLLDFGLAKLAHPVQPMISGLSAQLTATAPLTGKGTILGTLQYMAPEQLEGKEADARTDCFALGVVIHEMVTGRKVFDGQSEAGLITAILSSHPPPISKFQPLTPPLLDQIVTKCLAKAPEDRWQSARDIASALRWAAEQRSPASSQLNTSGRPALSVRLAWLFAALFVICGVAILFLVVRRAPIDARIVRFPISLPENVFMPGGEIPMISPDGTQLVFVASQRGHAPELWLRTLASDITRQLAGTDGAAFPFWAPDSQSIGFFAQGKLKRVEASGGTPQILCDAQNGLGGTWSQDGDIIFVPDAWSALARVSANGGTPQPATTLDTAAQEQYHLYPQFLPDGRHFTYLALTARQADSLIYIATIGSSERRRLMRGLTSAVYEPSGYLLFGRDGTVFAQRFDAKALGLIGEPVSIAQNAHLTDEWGATLVSVSRNGILAYRNAEQLFQLQLTWVDRTGNALERVGPPGPWGIFRISPNGRQVVLERLEPPPAGTDLWLLDVARGTITRFTNDPSFDVNPVWSPDGSRIVFSSDRFGAMNLFQKPADATTNEEMILESGFQKRATDWAKDGTSIVYMTRTQNWELWQLPLSGGRKPFSLVQNGFNNIAASFSPDGRWFAYESDESGRPEIYVQPASTRGGRVRISTNGGRFARWRRDQSELFYVGADNKLMSVAIKTTAAGLEPGQLKPLFALPSIADTAWPDFYHVSADGQRFLIRVDADSHRQDAAMTVIVNWPARLSQVATTRAH